MPYEPRWDSLGQAKVGSQTRLTAVDSAQMTIKWYTLTNGNCSFKHPTVGMSADSTGQREKSGKVSNRNVVIGKFIWRHEKSPNEESPKEKSPTHQYRA